MDQDRDSPSEEIPPAAAAAFVVDAFELLAKDRVIPRSAFAPGVAVGRDYEGLPIMRLPSFEHLAALLKAAFPERFVDPTEGRPEIAGLYLFTLLEACVDRSAPDDDVAAVYSTAVVAFDELLTSLRAAETAVVVCRFVADLTTVGEETLDFGNIEVIPTPFKAELRRRTVRGAIKAAIPSATSIAWHDEDFMGHRGATVVARGNEVGNPFRIAGDVSARIDRFLLLVCLATAGTIRSRYEVSGGAERLGRLGASKRSFQGGGEDGLIVRTAVLDHPLIEGINGLGELLDQARIVPDGVLITAFDMSLTMFVRSHAASNWTAQIVDLATALEAALLGSKSNDAGPTLQLRMRASALLWTPTDPASTIFEDVKHLYDLRSRLVHGSTLKVKDIRKVLGKISTVPVDAPFAVAAAFAVDRLGDIVRRSLLARIALAAGADPPWPIGSEVSVEQLLSDDQSRAAWRDHIRHILDAVGCGSVMEQAIPAGDSLTSPELGEFAGR